MGRGNEGAPGRTPEAMRRRAAEEVRLAAALRENLRRRKLQARDRAESPKPAVSGIIEEAGIDGQN